MNNRLFFSLSLLTAASNIFAQGNNGGAKQISSRPNIILFMVDDMGWQDTSLPFWTQKTHYNEVYETPNMERLARQGMMFTQAYACSVSSPSRCSLITGANAARHRVTNWTLKKNTPTDKKDTILRLPEWNYNGVCPTATATNNAFRATSFVQLLKDAGYHTIHCGKAHWGSIDTPGAKPENFGFDVNIAGHAGGAPASYLGEKNYGHDKDGKPVSPFAVPGLEKYWGTHTFVTEALTEEAIAELERSKSSVKPFYLYMSHYAIHIPIDKDVRFYQKFIDKGLSPKEAAYAALIAGMDKSLGDIMDWLEKNGKAKNTIILFMSDNGGLSSDGTWRDGTLHTQNHPLNSGKGSAYEGGIREPMIVYWNGVVKPGSKCDKYVMIEDFYPTILEMAGVKKYKTVQMVDGKSFVPLLKGTGDPSKGRKLYWNFPNLWGNTGPGIGATCTVRDGDWKLVYYYRTGNKELFNIKNDIGEKVNMNKQRPDLVKLLSKELGTYLRKVRAQRPTFKKTGKPCPWPDEI
jgi:arylsulfatase A-like enzyme